MEIRHTIEILTKDIQDIEKLVANLQNYQEPPLIEIDLALAKIRNLYDILLMIRSDQAGSVEQARIQYEKAVAPAPVPAAAPVQEPVAVQPVAPPPPPPPPVQEIPAQAAAPAPQASAVSHQQQVQAPPPPPAKQAEPQAPAAAAAPQNKPGEILAEKFQGQASINDNMSNRIKQSGQASRVSGQPIDSIARNIGINDRFLIIKELFEGDSARYNFLIDQLERAADFNEAFLQIEQQLGDRIDHDGTQVLVNLLRRKYIRGGNV